MRLWYALDAACRLAFCAAVQDAPREAEVRAEREKSLRYAAAG